MLCAGIVKLTNKLNHPCFSQSDMESLEVRNRINSIGFLVESSVSIQGLSLSIRCLQLSVGLVYIM